MLLECAVLSVVLASLVLVPRAMVE